MFHVKQNKEKHLKISALIVREAILHSYYFIFLTLIALYHLFTYPYFAWIFTKFTQIMAVFRLISWFLQP